MMFSFAKLMSFLESRKAQMTVELCVVLPVAIVIAVIAVNSMAFFGSCAAFDRVARNAVRCEATSPGYGQGADEACARILQMLNTEMDDENLECEVEYQKDSSGLSTYTMTLHFSPTLFGLGLRSSVLGVPLPDLSHVSRLAVDAYKPGMLL